MNQPSTRQFTTRLRTINPSRNFDSTYDPNCIISGMKDHAKIALKAQTNVRNIKCAPIFDNMFSDLVHKPPFAAKLEGVDPLPSSISREWQNFETVARETLIMCRRIHRDGAACYEAGHQMVANRFKYFDRPITPNICHKTPPTHFLALVKFAPGSTSEKTGQLPNVTKVSTSKYTSLAGGIVTKNASTQTAFRDGDAQTDPYSVSYTVTPGTRPEILDLAELTSKKGLPAGLEEIYMIERTRANRELEFKEFPETGKDKWKMRLAIMEANEICHWLLREKEIENLQEAKIAVLIELLKKRERRIAERSRKRFEALWERELDRKNAERQKLVKMKHEFVRDLRKLDASNKKKLQLRFKHRDIGKEYTDFGSQVFAPLTRVGYFLDRCAESYKVQNMYSSTYEGLCELENSANQCLLDICIAKPERKTTTKTGYLKHKYRYENMLIEMAEAIHSKNRGVADILPVIGSSLMLRLPKPPPKRSTPEIAKFHVEVEAQEQATLLLQAILRGRKIQNQMFEGADRMSELIQELRSIHTVQLDKKQMFEVEKFAMDTLTSKSKETEHKDSLVDSELSQMDSESLAMLLDFLSKEVIKLQEEQSLLALSVLIERQRRIREAEEAGQRQVEERRRREEEEIFKQVTKVNQLSIDRYLEDLVLMAVNNRANKEARTEVQELAQSIDIIVHDLEHRRTELESDAIVAELVNSFLLPEVQKEFSRQRVRDHQRGFLKAAHEEVYKESSNVFSGEKSNKV